MNLMLINVPTRRFGRSAERMKAWMSADLSQLDLLAIQIDGMHISNDVAVMQQSIENGG
jgi:hypothetical protein